jgi:beta-galactosidase/beta-glucuronidase
MLSGIASPAAELWKPAPGPLMTRWAAEVTPTTVLPEYPRPQMVRASWQNLNGLWDYALTALDQAPPPQWTNTLLVPFPIESALSGVRRALDEHTLLWYHRTFAVPEAWRGQRVRLHFGAVDWQATIYVNGQRLSVHRGGYDAFTLDITEALAWSGKEELVVAVFDPTEGEQPRGKQARRPGGIFYTPSSGIWQTVWLEPVPAVCIEELVLTPEVDEHALRLRVLTRTAANPWQVEAVALADGREVARAKGHPNTELVLPLPDPHLWSPKDPFLYDLKVSLRTRGQEMDQVTSYFGLRKVALGKDAKGISRFLLNNQPLFQAGVLDQGFWPDGLYTAPTDEALRSDLEVVKQLGFNLVRKHVKVEPDRWYYWCDRLGLLVWQDMPSAAPVSEDGRRQFEMELQNMVHDLGNHPAIVLWTIFNEGWGQYDADRLAEWVKRLDASRLVNHASGWTDMRAGDVVDLHRYPGPASPQPETQRAAVLGEFGGLGLALPEHRWPGRAWSYHTVASAAELKRRFADAWQRVRRLRTEPGLDAAVYTQLTDIETECDGLLTYDRKLTKWEAQAMRAAVLGKRR